mgnify:CR=1 FL=1
MDIKEQEISNEIELDAEPIEVVVEDEPRGVVSNDDSNADPVGGDDDDADARRQRRKQERAKKAQRQRSARQRDDEIRMELESKLAIERKSRQEMQQKLAQLDSMASQYKTETISKEISESEQVINYYNAELAKAWSVADGEAATRIMTARDTETQKLNNLRYNYQTLKTSTTASPQLTVQDKFLLEQQQEYTNSFLKQNDWFNDPKYKEEVEIARRIDKEVYAEGYNAGTKSYWNELNRRMKEELDYMYEDQKEPKTQSRNVVGGSTTGSSLGKGSTTLRFTADKVGVLKQLGIMDDNNKILDKKRAMYYYNSWNKKG